MQVTNNLLSLTAFKSRQMIVKDTETNQIENTDSINSQVNNSQPTLPCVSTSNVNKSLSVKDSTMTVADIKAAIYNRSHPSVENVTTTYGTSFDDICKTLGISPGTSITKSDLNKLTRNDSKEDANKDFCGALNRAFSYLKPTDTISYNDLMLFFMRGAGTDGKMNFAEYVTVVNQYSDIVQQQFEACADEQAKLEFVIEKTKDYLTESHMELQLKALKRLTTDPVASENVPHPDTTTYPDAENQVASVGQIAFANLPEPENGGINLGAYGTTIYGGDYHYRDSDVIMWGSDKDHGGYNEEINKNVWLDGGITLNAEYYLGNNNTQWYELVEVFVHELTHATAFYYYVPSENSISFSKRGLDFMLEKGLLTQTQYDKFFSQLTNDEWPEYVALVNSMWDEWAAYTTTCNYWDSIAGDVFEDKSKQDLAVNGPEEQDAIADHIKSGYEKTDKDGVLHKPIDPVEYFNWDYDTLQNMFYFDLNA